MRDSDVRYKQRRSDSTIELLNGKVIKLENAVNLKDAAIVKWTCTQVHDLTQPQKMQTATKSDGNGIEPAREQCLTESRRTLMERPMTTQSNPARNSDNNNAVHVHELGDLPPQKPPETRTVAQKVHANHLAELLPQTTPEKRTAAHSDLSKEGMEFD